MNELTQRGIAALKAGDRIAARQLLSAALRQDPADLQAWLWMTGAVERDEERLDCLRHIQRLEPGNQVAARGIAQILEKNPHLRPKVEQPLRPIDTTPQRPAISPQHAGHNQPIPQPNAVTAESSLLDRAVSAAQVETPSATQTIDKPARIAEGAPDIVRRPAGTHAPGASTAGGAAGAGRVIPIIYPRRPPSYYNGSERVFRSRPSLVPAILYFWLMVFLLYGTLIVTGQSELVQSIFPLVLALAVICTIFTIYILVRLYNQRYELTTEMLTLPLAGKKVEIPVWSILTVEIQQGIFQKFIGTGDIILDVPLDGMLSRVRVRNIPDVKKRAEQIQHLLKTLP